MKHQYPIVKVVWNDAAGVSDATTLEELSASKVGFPKVTIGQLFTDTPDGLRVGLSYGLADPTRLFEVVEINRPLIIECEYLWPHKKKVRPKPEPT